jgi:hypothetical protein
LIDYSGGDPVIAEEIVRQSIANDWQGIFKLKTNNFGGKSARRVGQSLPPVNEDEKNKLLAKIGG